MITGANRVVAVYSGEIPAPTFIESMIHGLAELGVTILLFGERHPYRYRNSNIKDHGNRSGAVGLLQFILRFGRLYISHHRDYLLLSKHIGMGPFQYDAFLRWRKYLPVVLFLPQIFHVQWAKSAEEWLFLKELFNVRLVLSLRGAHINYSPIADKALGESYKRAFPRYDAFHCVSKTILREGLQYNLDPSRSSVIHSVLPHNPGPLMANYRMRKDPLMILVVGRFHWKKGYNYLLDGLERLSLSGVRFHLTLVAKGQMPEELLFQLHDLKLKDQVTWIRGLDHNAIFNIMRENNVLVVSSLEEGIANVAIEAMSVGLPVISTDCGGMSELIEDGKSGFLVPVRDASGLAGALKRFSGLSDQEIEAIRHQAHLVVREQFDRHHGIRSFVDLYDTVG